MWLTEHCIECESEGFFSLGRQNAAVMAITLFFWLGQWFCLFLMKTLHYSLTSSYRTYVAEWEGLGNKLASR